MTSAPPGGLVLDPFGGAGTTLQRNAISIELNPDYCAMAQRRILADAALFNRASAA